MKTLWCFSKREQQTTQTARWGVADAWALRETDSGVWTDEDGAGEN